MIKFYNLLHIYFIEFNLIDFFSYIKPQTSTNYRITNNINHLSTAILILICLEPYLSPFKLKAIFKLRSSTQSIKAVPLDYPRYAKINKQITFQ